MAGRDAEGTKVNAAGQRWAPLPYPLVLASRSPQRRAILEQLGVPFEVRPADVDELAQGDPHVVALENARRKHAAIDGEHVLAVDTLVALDGAIYGKPRDEPHARATLRALSGRTHDVISGLVLDDHATIAVTKVAFREVDDALLDWYLASGEWRDRAGGYAIQGRGAALVEAIEGDYLNVVGLPVAALLDLLDASR
ncbi:dTTP/UTP pyrophosphatase [Capillimicrobium parvum]|uniref:Nucleoside triphosphate pyrophosphatase n=2 Tax=Capillimicrobium parvum TaxID=2884022 RepID=A0A9E6Y0J2_9ACTN|nr:dTTP/UTP pyrophosphatase [Capillimicrobium parvum]